ncbi:LOW QUALITY PROTEIN: DNA polymerase alpha catalytic subunit [Zootermopsis nevadensis]|uniref:LOW QUALITY PROTEIN: DNA polymerase alpha catalytic subunit n=1 Tax=Zootermopsis nevadensis TaxID=136037 RepID=UPI000B8E87B7|nr:LOW QUALITY PROTEIN: DNA polymerase alpha catalytic subunit [Zootermopsis nevadensis]
MEDSGSPLGPRLKRLKTDKKGRLAALEKLKQLKGSKHKYEISGVVNVYDEVDEREYTKKVLERQDDDWIVDDDGCGYVEDGREIFDDDLDDDSIISATSRNKRERVGSKKGKRGKECDQMSGGKCGSIRSLLMNMPAKKRKEAPVKLDEDAILGDIMEELNNGDIGSNVIRPTAPHSERKIRTLTPVLPVDLEARSYIQSLTGPPKLTVNSVIPKAVARTQIEAVDNEEKIKRKNMLPEDHDSDDMFVINTPSNDDTNPVTSEIIAEFDCNDIVFDEAVIKEVELECQKTENLKENVVNGSLLQPPSTTRAVTGPVKVGPEADKRFSAVWDTMATAGVIGCSSSSSTNGTTDVKLDLTQLPLVSTESGEKVLRIFWWDAYEEGFKQPGVVYLFGKVWIESAKTHVSCCVAVKNIQRRLYLLPREKHYNMQTKTSLDEDVTIMDVYKEFNEKIAERYKILEFKSRKVERNYAFSIPDIPVKSEYLEIMYPATQPMLPSDLQGETFSHVFGTNTSALEQLLLDRKMKGPCWLDVKGAQAVTNPVSWCKVENMLPSPSPPPLVVMTLNMRTVLHPTSGHNEIVMIGCLVHNGFHVDRAPPQPPFQQHFCAITRPSDIAWPFDFTAASTHYSSTKLEKVDTERALLGFFLAKLYKFDPDLIILCSGTRPSDVARPFDSTAASTKLEKVDTERALLGFFLAKLHKFDPDLNVGHDLYDYGLELLVHRMNINKIPQWSKLGRLRRANIQSGKGRTFHFEKNVMCGRLVCDVKVSAKELIKSRSYDLGALCQNVLHVKEDERVDVTTDEVKRFYGSSQSLLQIISCTMQDTAYIVRLLCELNVLPLALQITNIAGNVMSRTLMGGRSERNEFLLLHAFTEKNFIVPDKQYGKKSVQNMDEFDMDDTLNGRHQKKGRSGKRKPAYMGGLVLEPQIGFYDKLILLMDFNSLYPSIIQEYNICFTTVNLGVTPASNENEEEIQVELPSPGLEAGILPTEIRKLVESRCEVKKLMKNPDLTPDVKMQYNIRQMALKLTANSMYGCLGFSHSRFYAKPLAALVTAKGREILMNTKDLMEKMNFQVIYGDTDSIMINTNCLDYDQVIRIGHKIKAEVNKLYRQVELDIDGVFKYMLLLKKKKYAAVTISRLPSGELITQQELKGLDVVRRDWSQLSAEAGKYILQQILSDQEADERLSQIHGHLERLRMDLEAGQVPLTLLTITKQLTKNPEEYADKKSLPHVQVALRLNQHGGRKLKQGDTVTYIICEDGSNLGPTQRAYHVEELKTNENLKVDVKYYLSQQIHPVVSRLCDPIEGTDAARIAECLGLDPSNYCRVQRGSANEEMSIGEKLIPSDEERFRHCEKFKFICKNESCKAEIVMDGPVKKIDNKCMHFSLEKCSNPQCTVSPVQYLASVQNSLTIATQNFIHHYYKNWLVCEDPACTNRTRRVPTDLRGNYPHCNLCKSAIMYKEYTEYELYTQLSFFQHIFDLSKVTDKRPGTLELEKAYDKLREQAERSLRNNAYSVVNLGSLFQPLLWDSKAENCSGKS